VWSERGPLRYERLTWPEPRRAAAKVPATLDADARTLTVDEPALR
jgi:hypothetical protein